MLQVLPGNQAECGVIFFYKVLHNVADRKYAVNHSGYLSDFQFPLFRVPFKHTEFRPAPAQKQLQFFMTRSPVFCLFRFFAEFVPYQPHRAYLFQCERGVSVCCRHNLLFECVMG